MTAKKKLSNLVKHEKKIVSMAPGSITLRPAIERTVQLKDGSYTQINEPSLRYETLGEYRNSMTGRPLDPSIPQDAEILQLFEELLAAKPHLAHDVRYQIKILGEHEARQPWPGYDGQTAEQALATFQNMPEQAKPDVFKSMKYELERTVYDEDLDEEVSVTDDDKVKMWDELYKELTKNAKAESTDTVDLV